MPKRLNGEEHIEEKGMQIKSLRASHGPLYIYGGPLMRYKLLLLLLSIPRGYVLYIWNMALSWNSECPRRKLGHIEAHSNPHVDTRSDYIYSVAQTNGYLFLKINV